jgi:hypothetical protein
VLTPEGPAPSPALDLAAFRKGNLSPLPPAEVADEEGVIAEAFEVLEQLQRDEPDQVGAPAYAAPERMVELLEEEPLAEAAPEQALPERVVVLDEVPFGAPERALEEPALEETFLQVAEPPPPSPAPTAADREDELLARMAELRAEPKATEPSEPVIAPGSINAVARLCASCSASRRRRARCPHCHGRYVRLWVADREALPERGWQAQSDEERLAAVDALAELLPSLQDGAVRGALALFSAAGLGASPETRTEALRRWNTARAHLGAA